MNILIIAATKLEINNLISKINFRKAHKSYINNHNIDIEITGVGLVFTSYNLCRKLKEKRYDLVINVGIAGSFNKNLQIGELVNVEQEEFADIGAERNSGFKTVFELGFTNENKHPFKSGKLANKPLYNNILNNIKSVSAISANTSHGTNNSIEAMRNKFEPDIETMEGAAVFFICMSENIECLQIRAISNYVEPYCKDNWNIPLAVKNLNDFLIRFLEQI